VLPLARCLAWDRDAARAEAFAAAAGASGLDARTAADLATAALDSDVILACTSARRPYLDASMIRPGAFIAAVGADSPDKSEIMPALMARATVVADVLAQCAVMGDLHHALAAGAIDIGQVHAELAELVAGTKPGRTGKDQVTLFDSTGTAVQDVAAAAFLFQRALARPGLTAMVLAR
jgi:alanine dehydrogenase